MIVSPEQMQKIEEFALHKVKNLDYCHDKDHVLRTVKFVEILAPKEKADLEVCKVAAYLHDIGQSVQKKGHEEISAGMAGEFLKSLNLPDNFIEKVCHAIEHHKSSKIKDAKTTEAKVLYDADKLQVVGVYAFCRNLAEHLVLEKLPLNEAVKLTQEQQEERFTMLQTKTARKMIKKPHEFMRKFYKLYDKWDKVEL
jgi:uncharacterized protein